MDNAEIRRLYDYNDWANDRMLEAIGGLTDEQYTREITSSFPSIRSTLGHIAGAEWIWLQRLHATSPGAPPVWAVDAPASRLADEMRSVASARRSFLMDLSEEQLSDTLAYRNLKGEPFNSRLLDVLLHVVNHSTYHRGQLTTMLRQAGAVPPGTDLIAFTRLQR